MTLAKTVLLIVVTATVSVLSIVILMLFWQDERSVLLEAQLKASPKVADFSLLDHNGRYHQLYRYRHAKAVVLYSHGVGCPIVRNNMPTLQQLRKQYEAQGVEFLMINANPQDDRADLAAEATLLETDIPILKDDTQLVIGDLKIARTGEAILVDTRQWAIRYRGPIDDRLDYETQKSAASEHYLDEAIAAVLDQKPVAVPKISSVGCVINKEGNKDENPSKKDSSIAYATDIVPILREKCMGCHRTGGVGPWAMDSYPTVKGWAAMMREVIMNKRMPPWHADPMIGEFLSDRSLSLSEQKTLIHWIDAGALNDQEHDPLIEAPPEPAQQWPLIEAPPEPAQQWPLIEAPPESAQQWPLGEPDLVIELPKESLPNQGLIPYRWIELPIPIKQDTWVRGVDLRPSNPAVMHHGFVFVKYPKPMKKEEPSWLEGLNGFFAAYVPGVNVLPFPEGSGQFLPAGSTLMFQLHYVTVGYVTEDQPTLALYFHPQPPAMEYKMASASNMQIRIPPHAPDHEEQAVTALREEVMLHGFYPHMHYRGSRFLYQAHYPDGTQEPLLSVPNYDINWQTFYRLTQPKKLPAGTKIAVRAAFDNSANNLANPDPSQEVKWGLKSRDEMLVGYIMYTRPREVAPALTRTKR